MSEQEEEMILKSVETLEIDPTKKYLVVMKYPDYFDVEMGTDDAQKEELDSIIGIFTRLGCLKGNVRVVQLFACEMDIQEDKRAELPE